MEKSVGASTHSLAITQLDHQTMAWIEVFCKTREKFKMAAATTRHIQMQMNREENGK